jgi:hypothetical protein
MQSEWMEGEGVLRRYEKKQWTRVEGQKGSVRTGMRGEWI